MTLVRPLRVSVAMVAAFALCLAIVMAVASPARAGGEGPPATWPAAGDVVEPLTHGTLIWPVPGDGPPQYTLTWPVPGDVPPQYALTWPAPGDEAPQLALVWPAPGDVTQVPIELYFCRCEDLVPVTRTVSIADRCCATAVDLLMEGPSAFEQYVGFGSVVPAGTELRSASVEDGVAHLDLTSEFASGGGTQSMYMRVGQLVYTATALPTVDAVEVSLEGEPLTAFGGEGLDVAGPLTRDDWDAMIQ